MGAGIVIVEDEQIIAADLEASLKRFGHQVFGIASNGEDGIALAKKYHPDVVLMDFRLRGRINGVQAATAIQAFAKIPIVFVTAFADSLAHEAQGEEALRVYLKKPFSAADLKEALSAAMKSA